MQCRECFGSKFDREGRCQKCGTISWEAEDAIKKAEFEARKKLGKL